MSPTKPLIPLLSAVLLWGLGTVPAFATPILIHQSTESLYSSGATSVTGCTGIGCPQSDFSFGSITGNVLWTVQEAAYRDTMEGTFSITYTVTNVGLTQDISSFHVAAGGLTADSWTSPTSWGFSQGSQGFSWSTDDLTAGIAPDGQKQMEVVFNDPGLAIVFGPASYNVINDVGMHVTLSSSNWMASSVATPEPGTFLLLGSGLLGFAYLTRRRRRTV